MLPLLRPLVRARPAGSPLQRSLPALLAAPQPLRHAAAPQPQPRLQHARSLSLSSRMSSFIAEGYRSGAHVRSPRSPMLMRMAERAANGAPLDGFAQEVYLQGLYDCGLEHEVVLRMESGRFAASWPAMEVYARCVGRRPEGELGPLMAALRSAWALAAQGGGSAIVPPNELRAAVLAGLRGIDASLISSSSGGGGGGAAYGGGSTAYGGGGGGGLGAALGAGLGTRSNPVIVESQRRTSMFMALLSLLPYAILAGVLYNMMGGSKSMSGFSPLGGDIAEEVELVPETRFEDVKGADEAKAELQDVVNFLRDPERYQRLGAKVPAGVLLTGPPGTGKTLLARAVAGEAGCKFYSKSASEFEEMLVGLGARRVRDLFAAAKKNAPAIIFIDEIDALGGKRRAGSAGGGSERQTLNQLLACMDGFAKKEGVIVIAATNTPDFLDPALTRPGRFDSAVEVSLPDVKGRQQILELYLKRCVVEEKVSAEFLARATPGFSGAQLEAMVNSAALMAAARGGECIEQCDLEEARDKLIMGPSKVSRLRNAEQQRVTAFHEGGHTLVTLLTRGAKPLHKVTILPRGQSGGATYMLPNENALMSRSDILAEIDVSMGGRAAEELVFGTEQVTAGASGDLQGASRLARAYCAAFAMGEVGMATYGGEGGGGGGWSASPERHAQLDAEVEKILKASYARVKALLESHRGDLDRLAAALLEHETLNADECRQAIKGQAIVREKAVVPAPKAQPAPQQGKAKAARKRNVPAPVPQIAVASAKE